MAARVKCLLPLLLLVGMLSLLTVSASDVNVTFVVEQRLEDNYYAGGVLLIRGNSSSLIPSRTMTLTPGDVWVLTVTLTKGVAYQYSLRVLPRGNLFECVCSSSKDSVLTVPEDYPFSYYAELVSGYNCNFAPCPRYTQGKSVELEAIRQVV